VGLKGATAPGGQLSGTAAPPGPQPGCVPSRSEGTKGYCWWGSQWFTFKSRGASTRCSVERWVRAAAKENTADAIKTLKTVMNNDHAPSAARVGAAIAILDRGWGKPMRAVEATVSVFDQMTDDEQKMLLAALEALKGD
jgi:hypothetical protein